MSCKVVSIDASTKKTGMAFFVNGTLSEYELLDCSEIEDKEERMINMGVLILKKLNNWNPDIVYIEDSWNAMNVEVTKMLTRIMGVTFAWCISKKREWKSILPATWRKYCGFDQGKKKRSELKDMSVNYVKSTYKIEVNDDVADAICIGDAMVNYYNMER